jgi:Zn-dependent M28 family amino/carboxypeptidase
LQGQYNNIVASKFQSNINLPPFILIGAHYDSVPGTPGADDNASAVASMLAVARALHLAKLESPPVLFVAFNREEDDLLGSKDFVQYYLDEQPFEIQEAHILEMVGYADHTPGSQRLPRGIPIRLPDKANFIGVVAKGKSNKLIKKILRAGKTYVPQVEILGLRVFLGLDKKVPDVRRSDHAPFWDKKIPALMWTDTSEFRNANYHLPSDTPDTLDYQFLTQVTRILLSYVLTKIKTG